MLAATAIGFAIVIFAGSNQPRISFRDELLAVLPEDPKPGSFPYLSFNRVAPKAAACAWLPAWILIYRNGFAAHTLYPAEWPLFFIDAPSLASLCQAG